MTRLGQCLWPHSPNPAFVSSRSRKPRDPRQTPSLLFSSSSPAPETSPSSLLPAAQSPAATGGAGGPLGSTSILPLHLSPLSHPVRCLRDAVDLTVAECFLPSPSTGAAGRHGRSPGSMSEPGAHACARMCTCAHAAMVRSAIGRGNGKYLRSGKSAHSLNSACLFRLLRARANI